MRGGESGSVPCGVNRVPHDPGWPKFGASVRSLWTVFMPGLRIRQFQQSSGPDADSLTFVRVMFIQYCAMLVVIGLVLVVLDATSSHPTKGVATWTAVVIVVGIVSLVSPRLISRPLSCSNDANLAGTYRTRFFLRVAFGNVPALMAFVASFATGEYLLFLLGCAFSVVALVYAAPSKKNIAADQRDLVRGGCDRSLLAALIGGTAGADG